MERRTGRDGWTEGRRRTPEKRRRGVGGHILAMFSCLVILVAVMYGGLALYDRYHEKPVPAASDRVGSLLLDGDGNLVDEDGNVVEVVSGTVVCSQEELDARMTQTALEAQSEGMEEVLDVIRQSLSDGSSVLETLRPLYPDHIVLASGGQYHFVPINRELAQSKLLTENLNILESGEVQYLENGEVISHRGIDVSKHQGSIDWNLVAQDGVEFAFIRVGNRGYGESGKLMEDDCFEDNIKGALAAGIKVGVYFYSQAVNETEVLEEASFVLEKIAPYQVECPVVFDVEKVSAGGRMNNITVEERTHLTKVFCDTIKNAGYRPMIYHNTEMGALMLDLGQLEEYDKWFAAYTDTLYYPYEYKIWQYSATGRVPGIQKDVDLNISFAPIWE